MTSSDLQNTEYQYVKGILEHDSLILETIYREYLSGIIAMVRKNKGTTEDAKDVFQEAILIIYEKARQPDFQLTGTFYNFLYGICRFLWWRQLKKKYRKDITLEEDKGYTIEEDIEKIVIDEEKRQLFQEALGKLGEDCQKVLQLFFDGVPLVDIAKEMGYSNSYIKLKKHNCKEMLSEIMKKDRRYRELI